MTQPTTNTPPIAVTQDAACWALRLIGLDPETVTEAHILPETIVVIWDRGQKQADAFRSYTSVIDIVPVATCANCGRGMNAGDAMCCLLPKGGAA